jgi:uncharacterized membrane protein SpoIIM required for sporulation
LNEAWFERRHAEEWDEFEALIAKLDAGTAGAEAVSLPRRYRRLCQQLALARGRRFGAHLVDRLHGLVLAGHRHLYAARRIRVGQVAAFIGRDFPRAVRAEARLCALASLLFYGPFLGMLGAIQLQPELAYSVIDRPMAEQYEEMYSPEAREEEAGRVAMFGVYVLNNASIGFRTFAGGLIFGVGSLFILVFNGVIIGSVVGHLTQAGYAGTLWPFLVGHGSFELTAIVISGMAGLKLGGGLLAPGRLPRTESLRQSAHGALPLVVGAGAMFVIAAAIEAFWSPLALAGADVKYAVGALLWALVGVYFVAAGRSGAD